MTSNTNILYLNNIRDKNIDDNEDISKNEEAEVLELATEINNIKSAYTDNINTLINLNNNMKQESIEHYDTYKQLKKSYIKERNKVREDYEKLKILEQHITDERNKLTLQYEEDAKEKTYFKNKVGLQNSMYQDTDIDDMIDILNTIKLETDIYKGLDESEQEVLKYVLDRYNCKEKEIKLKDAFKEAYVNEEEENLIKNLEDLVNDLVNKDKIQDIKITQINNTQYQFNDIKVNLIIENNEIKIKDNIENNEHIKERSTLKEYNSSEVHNNLKSWLIKNFPNKVKAKTNDAIESIQKTLNKATEKIYSRKNKTMAKSILKK